MRKICKNIAFSPSGDCLLGAACVCKKNQLWIEEVEEEAAPDAFIEWLDEQIKREDKLSSDMVFGYSSKSPAFKAAKEKYLSLNTQDK